VLTGILGGLVSSTATTMLYARRSAGSDAMRRLAATVVPLSNLVPLARVGLIAAVVAPAILPRLAPVLGAALAAGLAATALMLRGLEAGAAPLPKSRNPAELGAAIRFGAFYAVVLFASAWLSDLAGSRGFYAAAALSGFVDIDAIVLSGLNLFARERLPGGQVVAAIAIAYGANLVFKLGVLLWFNRGLALRAAAPFFAMTAAGAAVLLWP
jgi:uncharacterized membrane protein (DUF4010 family)